MPQTNYIAKSKKNSWSIASSIHIGDIQLSTVLVGEVMWDDMEEKENPYSLNTEEKIQLGDTINTFYEDIIYSWLRNKEMQKIYRKYDISEDEVAKYIRYFWGEKILRYIINDLRGEYSKNENHKYISTKFLDFIKQKNLWIEDILKMTIVLKNKVVGIFFDQDFKVIHQITDVFDVISTNISKNYNNTVIKLLAEYTNAIDNSNIISRADIHGIIISVNDEFCRLSGYKKEELIGKPHSIVRHPDMSKEVFKDLWNTIQDKRIWKWIIKNRTKIGWCYWVKSTVIPILDENNQIVEYISIRTDVTDLEITQQNLNSALEKQKELDLKKDEFLNIASHELRTPITSIKWYISMILDGDAGEVNDEVKSYLSHVYKSSKRLLELINDMLDISKIESGKQEFFLQAIDIPSLLKETVLEVKSLFEKKRQNFIISIDFEKFEYTTDENKLKQVLLNLLWNANKFTPEWGTIRLVCKKIWGEIMIRIEDNGIGVEKEHFTKIFEKFWQVKSSLTRDVNGTGLGLPIVKAIIEQMNGHIDMESEIWKGSKFSIYLPINQI